MARETMISELGSELAGWLWGIVCAMSVFLTIGACKVKDDLFLELLLGMGAAVALVVGIIMAISAHNAHHLRSDHH